MDSATPHYDVAVRGAGVVGRALALALSRKGLRVALLAGPPRPGSAPDLRAFALNPVSIALLRELKVWDQLPPDAATPVYDMRVEGDEAGHRLQFSAWTQAVEALAWIVDASALEDTLAAAVRFAPHVTELDADADVAATLQALCEGKASASRDSLGVDFTVERYGQTAVAARLVATEPHAGSARQWFRAPDVLALLPFDRPQPRCSYGLVWSLPDARARELLQADATTFEAALADATGGACGTLQLASERAGWPLMFGRAEPVCGAGWVLLGDAAHVVHPLAGQGLNLGLADVASLVQVIAEREPWRSVGDERLLRRHVRERSGPTRAMGQLTDGLLHLYASDLPLLRTLRNRGLSLVDRLSPVKRWLTGRALGA
jgi:2-polyprenyl-6-methoxyphenol hydroxylase-like FAD-dependent oxidoreductase